MQELFKSFTNWLSTPTALIGSTGVNVIAGEVSKNIQEDKVLTKVLTAQDFYSFSFLGADVTFWLALLGGVGVIVILVLNIIKVYKNITNKSIID